jgi:hypothetical protein
VYTFVASYDGDLPNTKSIGASGCPDTTNTEKVTVVGNAHFTTEQDWLPNDTATLTGDTTLNGTLTFTLYSGGTCAQNGGVSKYTKTITVTNGDPAGASYSTDNSTFKVKASGTYSWLVHYHDNVQTSPPDSCSEVTTLTITN